ncbi:MAG: hypothetical protein EOO74_00285 [Myxococcales bacterium]|nr:MAG: hypothetical protein EOO74_00285 [Myxococcales bacterium]
MTDPGRSCFAYSRESIRASPLPDEPHVIVSITGSLDDPPRRLRGPSTLGALRLGPGRGHAP